MPGYVSMSRSTTVSVGAIVLDGLELPQLKDRLVVARHEQRARRLRVEDRAPERLAGVGAAELSDDGPKRAIWNGTSASASSQPGFTDASATAASAASDAIAGKR